MRIFFDQGTPAPLRRHLTGHTVSTAFEIGWSNVANGELITRVEAGFDAMITTDKNLRYPQNLADRKLAILVLPTTSWPRIERHVALVVEAVNALRPGEFRELELPE